MKVNLNEQWSIGVGGFTVAGVGRQASQVTVTVELPGSGYGMNETPWSMASVTMGADEWREVVRTVEARLIQRGDPLR